MGFLDEEFQILKMKKSDYDKTMQKSNNVNLPFVNSEQKTFYNIQVLKNFEEEPEVEVKNVIFLINKIK